MYLYNRCGKKPLVSTMAWTYSKGVRAVRAGSSDRLGQTLIYSGHSEQVGEVGTVVKLNEH